MSNINQLKKLILEGKMQTLIDLLSEKEELSSINDFVQIIARYNEWKLAATSNRHSPDEMSRTNDTIKSDLLAIIDIHKEDLDKINFSSANPNNIQGRDFTQLSQDNFKFLIGEAFEVHEKKNNSKSHKEKTIYMESVLIFIAQALATGAVGRVGEMILERLAPKQQQLEAVVKTLDEGQSLDQTIKSMAQIIDPNLDTMMSDKAKKMKESLQSIVNLDNEIKILQNDFKNAIFITDKNAIQKSIADSQSRREELSKRLHDIINT